MKINTRSLLAALMSVAALIVATSNATASDPVGVYAFVDKVVLEPNETQPQRIQVWGGFALAQAGGNTYAPAKRGYMYFTIKPGAEEATRKEWADIKALAGTGEFIAFGARHQSNGTIRAANAKPEKPDNYVTGIGLVKIKAEYPTAEYPPIKDLSNLKKTSAPTKTSIAK